MKSLLNGGTMIHQTRTLNELISLTQHYKDNYDDTALMSRISSLLVPLSEVVRSRVEHRYPAVTELFETLEEGCTSSKITLKQLEQILREARDVAGGDSEDVDDVAAELVLLLSRPDDYEFMSIHMYQDLFRVAPAGRLLSRMLLIVKGVLA